MRWILMVLAVTTAAGCSPADEWTGDWVTDLGAMELEQAGSKVVGSYGQGGTLSGKVEGAKLVVTWTRGRNSGTAEFERGDDHDVFAGSWKSGGNSGTWRGWRRDPKAEDARPADFSGVWLSSLGTMVLEQKGTKVKGPYGSEGWSSIQGEVKGRRLHLTWRRIRWSGPAWIELTKAGDRFFGLTEESPPVKWLGVRAKDFARDVQPRAGKVVQGLSGNSMLYFLRAPTGWRKGKKTDAIVLLHGSNWTTKGMVGVTARNWPKLAKRYMLVGIQGQSWADFSDPDDLRHNYTYVNWMGRSTYKGYPYTDRESPFLVKQVIEELKEKHGIERVFLGGHSQGGFLAYILYMHYPELFAGVFPMSGGLVMQAEPDVFEDEELLAAQRATPLAIVHGRNDTVVPFKTGQYIHERFLASEFPKLRFFAPDRPHAYDFLPVDEIVGWLATLAADQGEPLAAFAKERAAAKAWRDVAAAVVRAKELKASSKLKAFAAQLDAAASAEAAAWLAKIEENADGAWIDGFLTWRDQFEFAPAAAKTMKAFYALRDEHDPEAERLIGEARKAFRGGDRDGGWARYQQIVDAYYAARRYRNVKTWLADRR